ncbi:hypothetical protein [Paeniglutamicibacter sp. NPDC091659]|uniref:hypothetical protein n=1 Tax=Paeniglutamicibacter sp. NPDC091659 TaxID=3364389 RepID=UPI00380C7B10
MSAISSGFAVEQRSTSNVRLVVVGAALAFAIVGVVYTGFNPMWIAGSLGISAAAASQIVAAIKAGRSAVTVVAAIAGAGVASAITATIAFIVVSWAAGPAIA